MIMRFPELLRNFLAIACDTISTVRRWESALCVAIASRSLPYAWCRHGRSNSAAAALAHAKAPQVLSVPWWPRARRRVVVLRMRAHVSATARATLSKLYPQASIIGDHE